MRYRRFDSNGDYSFGHGAADFLRDSPECVAQAVMTRLRLLSGEWFLDLTEGTPYVQGVFGKHTRETYDLVLQERILGTQGVTEILEYESIYDGDTRKLTVNVKVDTAYGPVTIYEVM